MDEKNGYGYANGKIILIGEHAVVYHQPSIALPFPATTVTVSVTPNTHNQTTIDCDFYRGLVADMPELLESLKRTIELSLEQVNQCGTPLTITIDSTIPAERGMGSSAAVAVALTRGIFDYFDAPLSQEQLLTIVHEGEKIAHGNPSGLDALMTSSHTPYYFIKGQEPKAVPLNLDAYLIVADTGMTGQTKKVVEKIAKKVSGPDKRPYEDALYQLGQLTNQASRAIQTNDPILLGTILNQAQEKLRYLGASNHLLDQLITVAQTNGALGAKLTGGGAGGCLIALAATKEDAQQIQTALENNGAKATWLYEMSDLKYDTSKS